jgi:protein ImuB
MTVWLALALSGLPLQSLRQTLSPTVQSFVAPVIPVAGQQQLLCWAYRFSAQVAWFPVADGAGLILEIGASRQLLGEPSQASSRVLQDLQLMGYQAAEATAQTPAAARLLARARLQGFSCPPHAIPASAGADHTLFPDLMNRLTPLPVSLLTWPPEHRQRLQTLGQHTLHDLFRLPRAALARRFGTSCLQSLDDLLGLRPDPQRCWVPPSRFCQRLELPADLIDTQSLMLPLQRLLLALEGYLQGRGTGAMALVMRAFHDQRHGTPLPPSVIELALAVPERDPQALLALFHERFHRWRLSRAATALQLDLQREHVWPERHEHLFPGTSPALHHHKQQQLLQTFQARLGDQAVFQLVCQDDIRPEYAEQAQAPVSGRQGVPHALRSGVGAMRPGRRPAWLLRPAQVLPFPVAPCWLPRYRGVLSHLAGPERIESGWWDPSSPSAMVRRDYFVARNPHGQTLWIYREHEPPHAWYLHGFFA